MQTPDAMKPMNAVEFVQHAEAAGHTITGWVSLDRTNKQVLFSPTPDRSPWLPLPKDWTVQLLDPNPFPCPGSPLQLRWSAQIRTATPEPGSSEATLIELVVSLATMAQDANRFGSSGIVRPLDTGVAGVRSQSITATFRNATTQYLDFLLYDQVVNMQVPATIRSLKPGDSFQYPLAVNRYGYGEAAYVPAYQGETLPRVLNGQMIDMEAVSPR
jgi:hypothetical protein